MKPYDRTEERTGVQEARDFEPIFDVQSDFVMVYGFHDLKNRVKKWKKAGYVIHLMTGVSWGEYQDYLFGRYDGVDHHDEGQRNRDGSERGHGKDVPYMVPSNSFAHYLAENLKFAVDCGVEAIHLEEPEFWVHTGYSDAFKREWKIYYKEDWQDPQSSPEAQYRASKLKQYLYTRTLDRLCSELKEYAMVKYGRLLRFYVPTHSLINYSQWKIVSPESALIDLPTVDGYIAQIWTGTARSENFCRGVRKERTFETAFLEYGVMQELVRGTGRRMWFLADPIEDNPQHTWVDYRENYYRTVIASLFHPDVSDYEVSPWPARVMRGRHLLNDGGEPVRIPAEYKTNLLQVMHLLRDMKSQTDVEWLSDTPEVGVLMADSAMFQRICPAEGGDDSSEFSSFFGLALPLLKAGIAARPVQLDNVRRFPGYLDPYRTLVLSYEYMKPSSPDINGMTAEWVKNGGRLIYVGDGSDPFHSVREWWNQGDADYRDPAEHLFESMGLGRTPDDGVYEVGAGSVTVIRRAAKSLALESDAADSYLAQVKAIVGDGSRSNLVLRRGPYVIAAAMDEADGTPVELEGTYIDLFDHELRVLDGVTLESGGVGLYYDVTKMDRSESSELIALSGRAEKMKFGQRSLTFVSRSPSEMTVSGRVWTKRPPKSITAGSTELSFDYEPDTETSFFSYPSDGTPVSVKITF